MIETAVYGAELAQIDQIARAKEVRVKVTGTKGFVERNFAAKNFQNFREFSRQVHGKPTP